MIDRIFSALLTFCLLAGGTAAIGSALFESKPAAQPTTVITLPTVEISGTRPGQRPDRAQRGGRRTLGAPAAVRCSVLHLPEQVQVTAAHGQQLAAP